MRVSVGPVVDEGGWGYSMNLVQAKNRARRARPCSTASRSRSRAILSSSPSRSSPMPRSPKSGPKLKVGIVLDELVA
jgi:hypothetical protein